MAPADHAARPRHPGTDTAAVAPPALGRSAVTAAQATARADLPSGDVNTPARLEPPADPPPVKGLGIPPLHMAQVGDRDKGDAPVSQKPTSSLPDAWNGLAPHDPPILDRRS
jgi:hypothetical protein